MCLQGHKDWFEVIDIDGASLVLVTDVEAADVYGAPVDVSAGSQRLV